MIYNRPFLIVCDTKRQNCVSFFLFSRCAEQLKDSVALIFNECFTKQSYCSRTLLLLSKKCIFGVAEIVIFKSSS